MGGYCSQQEWRFETWTKSITASECCCSAGISITSVSRSDELLDVDISPRHRHCVLSDASSSPLTVVLDLAVT